MLRYSAAASCQHTLIANEDAVSNFGFASVRPFEQPAARPSISAAGVGPLVSRLQRLYPLPMEDILALETLTRNSHARVAGHPLFDEDTRCDHVCVLIEGVACRYRMLTGGRRQILGYILPGDICDVQFVTLGATDHSVGLLTKGLVAKIAIAKLREVLAASPAIQRAVEMAALMDKSILRQWLVNMAQLSAIERLGHFLCEYLVRMEQIGCLSDSGSVPFEINQVALADTLGMSTVHVNRTLQALRAANLLVLRKRHLHVLDREQLVALASFKPDYLQVRGGAS